MDNRESVESALLLQIGALERKLATLSSQVAGLHLRREAARLARDTALQEGLDERMRAVETEMSGVQQELLRVEKRYHHLLPLPSMLVAW